MGFWKAHIQETSVSYKEGVYGEISKEHVVARGGENLPQGS